MLVHLAWKNIWRNKKRSLIIIISISLGLFGGLLAGAIMMGWGESMVNTDIDRDLAHIQIHEPGYQKNKEIINYIPDGLNILEEVRRIKGVKGASGRMLIEGMAASPISTFGVLVECINPNDAKKVNNIADLIIEGNFFKEKEKNPIVIGNKLAKRLDITIGSKVVLSFQDINGTLVYAAFRISGIFKSESSLFDESHVFLRQDDAFQLVNSKPIFHEIAIRVESEKIMPQVYEILKNKYPSLSIETWKEIAPEIAFTATSFESFTYLFVSIILLALIFGITNTMLMAVTDRIREIGVLIAVGMKKEKVFIMIIMETIMLSLTGGIFGIIISGLTIEILFHKGIDLSKFASSLESFGASTTLYPFLPAGMYIMMVILIIIAANLAAILPAWKAMHFVPSKAIRTS